MTDVVLNPYSGIDWHSVERHTAQFHAHTAHPPTEGHSGSDPPGTVIDDYREAGYSVLALSDHEYTVEEPTWPWTDWDRDPAELGMVAIQAVELGGAPDSIDHDLLSLFCDLADTTDMDIGTALATIGERGGLAIFPHPGRYHDDGTWYVEHFRAHPHLLGVEVINADDRYPAGPEIWDDLQARLGTERPVWGFADDDYHGRAETVYSFDRSRNVLLVETATEAAVRTALIEGRFYYQHVDADEPPAIEAVRHDPDRGELAIEARNAETVEWLSEDGVVHRGRRLPYRSIEGLGSFARARVRSPGDSVTGTQPFLFE